MSPAHSSVLIKNQCLTWVHSVKDHNISTYAIYVYPSHYVDHKTTIRTMLKNQLTRM
jgi:hypothetical protein